MSNFELSEYAPAIDECDATVVRRAWYRRLYYWLADRLPHPRSALKESGSLEGRYSVTCIGADGKLKWSAEFPNTVVVVGKDLALDTILAGTGYTVTGPYMFLISNSGFSAVSSSDTMSSHSGWAESTCYSGSRPTCAWSSASAGSKSLSAALSFSVTSTDTIVGVGIVFGSGASSTVSNTGGTLFSAGQFTGGNKGVANGDTLNVSYSISV